MPLTLIGGVLELSSALSVQLGRPVPQIRSRITRWIVLAMAVIGIASAAQAGFHEWTFWSLQVPLVSTFLLSGVFAAGALEGRWKGPKFFFAVTWLLAVTPLVIEEVWPYYRTHWRANGSPTLAILQFVGWSFGGPMPDCVIPDTEVGFERGVGFPPRFVTVPMSTILIAAWTSIVFTVATFLLRRIRNVRLRLSAAFVFAPMLGTLTLFLEHPIGAFDPLLFGPESFRDSGVWRADPYTMSSFGSVVLTALLCVAALLVTTVQDGARQCAVVRDEGSG